MLVPVCVSACTFEYTLSVVSAVTLIPALAVALTTLTAPPLGTGECVVVAPLDGPEMVIGGDECRRRTLPASTFKVPHALIALETGVIGEEEKLTMPPNRTFPRWGGEHTLRSATHDSVVTFFQAMARRIGQGREKEWLRKLEYGNEDGSGPVDQFWLNGTLRISPDEQVSFLEKLASGKLPVSRHTAAAWRDDVTVTEDASAVLLGPGTAAVVRTAAGS